MAQMGRPRTFDRDQAIEQAMLLFWEYGYDATSLSLLKSNIAGGIKAPSFYAAFGSKEALFREVVARYIATYGQVCSSLWNEHLTPREAIELALRQSAKMQTESSHPKGCLLVLSAGVCSPENQSIQQLLSEQREKTREKFQQCVQRAVNTNALPANTEVCAYTASLHSFLLGLSMQARDGVSSLVLNNAVTEVMLGWDARANMKNIDAK